jgi:alkylation response protein AidB-like acyl-CoA dehydrogenase
MFLDVARLERAPDEPACKGGNEQLATHKAVPIDPERGQTAGVDSVIPELRTAIAHYLQPLINEIDENGLYPKQFMHHVGALGGFKQGVQTELGGSGVGIKGTIQVMEEIAKACLSTGFITWCQTVCTWYIQNSDNTYLKQQLLPGIMTGQLLAGPGLSNVLKHYGGIENIYLTAQRRNGGYLINGALPWVSNLAPNHYLAIAAKVETTNAYLMAIIPANTQNLTLGSGGHFIALEGSATYSCRFKDVFVPTEYILADPCTELSKRIQPGMILSQTGFGLGLVRSCIDLMKHANVTKGHVNQFLDDQVDAIEADFLSVRQAIYRLAEEIGCGEQKTRADLIKDVIQTRITISKLSLRASQATMLHLGSSAYRLHSTAERRLRESYFVAIVTPALKHLKKLQSDLN